MNTYIATFYTHFDAIEFARLLKNSSISYRMMPVPRKLSSSCGTCVRCCCEDPTTLPTGQTEGLYQVIADGKYLPVDTFIPKQGGFD